MSDTFHVRIGHFVPGAPALDILVDGHPVLTDREYGDMNEYTEHRADEYTVSVTETGSDAPLVEESVTFDAGVHYTLLLIGSPEAVALHLLADGGEQNRNRS